ncbi:MAG: nucleotidyltransferase [Ignavibacteria bacterium]
MPNLNDLLDHINFKSEDLTEIEEALKRVTDTIDAKSLEGKIPKAFYKYAKYGSIDRKTKIKPLNDIDLFYLIGSATKNSLNGHLLEDCHYFFQEEDHDPYNNISSRKLLFKLKSAIKEKYSTSEIIKNNEVVNVWLDSYDVGFDIAPAFYVLEGDYYLIPEGGDSHYWKETNPFAGKKVFERINNYHNGFLRDVIKIIKYWFKQKKISSPGSYHIECVLCHYFNSLTEKPSNFITALYWAFLNINYKNYLLECENLSNINKNLTDKISSNLTLYDINKIETEAEIASSILKHDGGIAFVNYLAPEIE